MVKWIDPEAEKAYNLGMEELHRSITEILINEGSAIKRYTAYDTQRKIEELKAAYLPNLIQLYVMCTVPEPQFVPEWMAGHSAQVEHQTRATPTDTDPE